VLTLRDVEVDRMQEAVFGVVERAPERVARAFHEDIAQRRGHALRAITRQAHRHSRKDSRGRHPVVG
jgi:hypothetical protein